MGTHAPPRIAALAALTLLLQIMPINADVYFLNTDWSVVHTGEPTQLYWLGDGSAVDIALFHGPESNMQWVRNVTNDEPGNMYTWIPRESNPEGTYSLVIYQSGSSFRTPAFQMHSDIAHMPPNELVTLTAPLRSMPTPTAAAATVAGNGTSGNDTSVNDSNDSDALSDYGLGDDGLSDDSLSDDESGEQLDPLVFSIERRSARAAIPRAVPGPEECLAKRQRNDRRDTASTAASTTATTATGDGSSGHSSHTATSPLALDSSHTATSPLALDTSRAPQVNGSAMATGPFVPATAKGSAVATLASSPPSSTPLQAASATAASGTLSTDPTYTSSAASSTARLQGTGMMGITAWLLFLLLPLWSSRLCVSAQYLLL